MKANRLILENLLANNEIRIRAVVKECEFVLEEKVKFFIPTLAVNRGLRQPKAGATSFMFE